MVFMGHGLAVALFTATSFAASAAFWRTGIRVVRFAPTVVTTYLGVLLILCKTWGALFYAAIMVPLVRFARPRSQILIAVALATFALLYPILKTADLVPTKAMVEYAKSINEERGQSLETRFDNEQQLLDRASQRIWFGWGRFGRSRVYGSWGGDISITDGRWIITIGQFGIFGFVAEFGLLALPIWRAMSALRFTQSMRDQIFLSTLALILAINMIDLLPNSDLTPWTWLLTGALLGRAEALRATAFSRQRSQLAPSFGGDGRRTSGLGV
jgi:hypothetical protein